jgi:hydroxymethylbilane synthase
VPPAAHAVIRDGQLHLHALVAEPDGTRILRAHAEGPATEAETLGGAVARDLLGQGADAILARLSEPTVS